MSRLVSLSAGSGFSPAGLTAHRVRRRKPAKSQHVGLLPPLRPEFAKKWRMSLISLNFPPVFCDSIKQAWRLGIRAAPTGPAECEHMQNADAISLTAVTLTANITQSSIAGAPRRRRARRKRWRRCCGLDVHKETVVACLRIVSGGEAVRKVRTFQTTTASLIAVSEWLAENGCTHVAMEATGIYWKPVWHILTGGGFQLVLANASHVKNVPGRKTDVNDAAWLADLLAHGLIRASFVPDTQTQELRALLRTRKQLLREKASHILRMQKTLEDANIKLDSVITDVMGMSGRGHDRSTDCWR